MDGRRQPFVALGVLTAFSDTEAALMREFGPVGCLAWHYLICAAKRAPVQGTFTYVTEHEFWEHVGIPIEYRPDLDEFLGLLGRMKQVRRTSRHRRHRRAPDAPQTRPR
jgi:hypothetical protein